MQPANTEWDFAVAYARKELAEVLPQLAELEEEFPADEWDLVQDLTKLERLRADDPSHDAAVKEDLISFELRRSGQEGIAPQGAVPKASPYAAYIEVLIGESACSPAAFEALGIHAAGLISDNSAMIPQLRIFVTEVLRGKRTAPLARGTPRVHPSRDRVLYALLVDIVQRYRVTPTRNGAATSGTSACDVVAEAMPFKARLPKAYYTLERIWIRGQREEASPE